VKREQRKGLKLEPACTVSLGLGSRKVIGELDAQILRAIDQTGSYSEAARTLSLSYPFVWNRIARIERLLDMEVVNAEQGGVKGGRAVLTREGRRLLESYSELDSRVRRFITGNISSRAYSSLGGGVRTNLSFVGSHCVVVERALGWLHDRNPKMTYQMLNVGSWAGLIAMMLRQADIAGIHIFDETTLEYNQPLLSKFGLSHSCVLIRGYRRQQCMMVRKGNPKRIRGLADLLRRDVKLANRNLGSGTRILLDGKLHELARSRGVDFDGMTARIRGYDSEMMTHRQVAAALSSRRANVGIGLTSIAAENGLDFIPIAEEFYDFLVKKRMRNPNVREFFDTLASKEFQRKVLATPGITFTKQTGQMIC
jgi:molybdate transport repressor ModE-like protein